MANRRWWLATVVGLIFLLAGLGAAAQSGRPPQGNDTLGTVNGEPLLVQELRQSMKRLRAETVLYFQTQYGAVEDETFWTREIGGEVPIERLKQTALKDLVALKLQQIAARDKGIIDSAGYNDFLQALDQENKRRSKAVRQGEIIYGPQTYTEDAYFDYVFTNMQQALKEALLDGDPTAIERRMKDQYDKDKNMLYRLTDTVKVHKIAISYVDADGTVNPDKRIEGEKRIREAAALLQKGEPFDTVAERYNPPEARADHGAQVFDPATASRDQKENPRLAEEALKLEKDGVSGILELSHTFYLLWCVDKKTGGYRAFEEVKDQARSRLIEQNFTAWLDREVKQAVIDIDADVYGRIRSAEE